MATLVYIAVGSNLQNPLLQVHRAMCVLQELPDLHVLAASSCYRSSPMGPQDQPDYINAVVKAETGLDAEGLLDQLQSVESEFGRVRDEQRWGPRVLDLDILLYGTEHIQTDRLTVPHAGITQRAFVLVPLFEIEKHLMIPDAGSIESVMARLCADDINLLEKL